MFFLFHPQKRLIMSSAKEQKNKLYPECRARETAQWAGHLEPWVQSSALHMAPGLSQEQALTTARFLPCPFTSQIAE